MPRLKLCVVSLLAMAFVVSPAMGQVNLSNLLGDGDDPLGATEVKFTLEPADAKPGDVVTMKIDLTFPPDSHTYSQDKSFGGRTKITVATSTGVEALGEGFVPDHQPKLKDDPILGQVVQVFEKPVIWSQKFRIDSAAKLSDVLIEGKVNFQVCDANTCQPNTEKFSLRLADPAGPVFEYRYPEAGAKRKAVKWVVTLSPEKPKVGDKVTLKLAAKIDEGYHVFGVDHNPDNYGKPTELRDLALNGLKAVDDEGLVQDRESEKHVEEGKEQRIHHNEVNFTQQFLVHDADAFGVGATCRFQYCQAGFCVPGRFSFALGTVAPSAETGPTSPGETSTGSTGSGAGSALLENLEIREPGGTTEGSLVTYLIYAFLGGLILNVMPCVLPVIAIKVLSFVQQAGEDRSRILVLNLVYSLGIVSVFLGLAATAHLSSWGWGGLFERWEFSVGITAFVFVMALSLLGVFEIPIPGFVGNAAGTQQQEGLTGAFLTGVFATILATPCTGPFMGTALAWSVKQDPAVIYMVWGMMGVGMSTPYLLFGAFPGSVKYLPKPGNWMVTFKQICGFVLLATVVFLLYGLSDKYVVPTLVLLLGLGVGLWMIGNLYTLASPRAWRMKMQVLALFVTCTISGLALYMVTAKDHLDWKPYSGDALAQAMKEGNIVLVDFTADW